MVTPILPGFVAHLIASGVEWSSPLIIYYYVAEVSPAAHFFIVRVNFVPVMSYLPDFFCVKATDRDTMLIAAAE